MKLFRKLARRKVPPNAPESSSAANLIVSTDLSTPGCSTGSRSGEEQRLTAQKEHRAPERSGHRYDGVNTGGESKNHLGDVYANNVTYNYGAPRLPSGSKEQTSVDAEFRSPAAARLEEGRNHEREDRFAKEQQRRELMSSLRFDAMNSRSATIAPAHTDTCTWIVEAPEYVGWRDQSRRHEHHGVLWIKGKPGSGKSTLMKYALGVAQERDHNFSIVSFFFNARGQSLEKSAEGMYRSLLQQILSKLPHIYSGQTHVKDQFWPIEVLENMFRQFILSLKLNGQVVCYIDALDECTEAEVRDVVGLFEDLVDLTVSRGINFSVCFSSRHYPHITMHRFQELKLDDRDEHLQDISKYVHTNVGRLDIPHSSKDDIEVDIERRSSGVFIWVVLVIKMLRKKRDQGASHSELVSSLAKVPDKLGDLFASILGNSGEDTIVALLWIMYARRPLTPQELYFAIMTSTHQLSTGSRNAADVDEVSIERFVMRSTRGLVETFEDPFSVHGTMFLQFIHESVRDHLLQSRLTRLTAEDLLVFGDLANAQLARWCLSYIHLDSSEVLALFEHRRSQRNPEAEFPFLLVAMENMFYQSELAYGAGVLSIDFLSEISLELLIRCHNIFKPREALVDSATLLFLLLKYKCYALATALLGACSKTRRPGHCTYRTTQGSIIAFDIDAHCHGFVGSALGSAAWHGNVAIVQLLLDHGAEVNTSREVDWTPLVAAVSGGCKEAVELLIQQGADVNLHMSDKGTALEEAAFRGSYTLASLLLDHGADANLTTGDYGSPLAAAIAGRRLWSDGEHDKVMRLLLDHGAQVNRWQRTSPLWAAAIDLNDGRFEMTRYVLELGAEVDARNPHLPTVLYHLASNSSMPWNNESISEDEDEPGNCDDKDDNDKLKDEEGDEDESDDEDGTSFAASRRRRNQRRSLAMDTQRIIEMLLENGADINVVYWPYGTPLIAATTGSRYEIVSTLLAHGADIHYPGEYGTALDVALERKRVGVARLLWSAHCSEIAQRRGRVACNVRVGESVDDTAIVHRMGYPFESDDKGEDSSDSDNSDESDISITSAKTI